MTRTLRSTQQTSLATFSPEALSDADPARRTTTNPLALNEIDNGTSSSNGERRAANVRYGGRSDQRTDWRTPPSLLRQIYDRFGIDFDPCPYPRPLWDGLSVSWGKRCFVNPPYTRRVGDWFRKALAELRVEKNSEMAVFLIHARSDTAWFHENVMEHANELYAIRGRVGFIPPPGCDDSSGSAFPSMMPVFLREPRSGPLVIRPWIME